jgi:L,D-peptidoglycan transpeptidase YkuD (ErfK/YbiS/YcfS/YnhG family)
MSRRITRLTIIKRAGHHQLGTLIVGQASFVCALGRTGVSARKREGDGATPRGRLPLQRIFFRADRQPRLQGLLPITAINPTHAWCDDATDRRYNRLICLESGESEERLWRKDHVYDVVVALGWNHAPVRKGRGSAIFWHLARPGHPPTAGCIAVNSEVFRKVLPRLSRHCVMQIL